MLQALKGITNLSIKQNLKELFTKRIMNKWLNETNPLKKLLVYKETCFTEGVTDQHYRDWNVSGRHTQHIHECTHNNNIKVYDGASSSSYIICTYFTGYAQGLNFWSCEKGFECGHSSEHFDACAWASCQKEYNVIRVSFVTQWLCVSDMMVVCWWHGWLHVTSLAKGYKRSSCMRGGGSKSKVFD